MNETFDQVFNEMRAEIMSLSREMTKYHPGDDFGNGTLLEKWGNSLINIEIARRKCYDLKRWSTAIIGMAKMHDEMIDILELMGFSVLLPPEDAFLFVIHTDIVGMKFDGYEILYDLVRGWAIENNGVPHGNSLPFTITFHVIPPEKEIDFLGAAMRAWLNWYADEMSYDFKIYRRIQ